MHMLVEGNKMQVERKRQTEPSLPSTKLGIVPTRPSRPDDSEQDTFDHTKTRWPRALIKLRTHQAISLGLTAVGLASLAAVKAQPQCAADDFSCWDSQPEPIDMYARLEEDLRTLDFGGCPSVCLMTPTEAHVAGATAGVVGAIFFQFRRAPGILGKIAATAAAAFGAYAAVQTKEFINIAKARCQQMGCPTEPLW